MTNVDPKEIDKFAAMAHQWWDPEGQCKPLHHINPLRLEFIQQQVKLKNQRCLDVGCGGGILTEGLAKAGAKATGIDLAKASIQIAQLHLHESKLDIDYQIITAEDFAAEHAQQFDVITCMEMLEHVPEPESVINACANCLKPGGWAFFSTLNRNPKAFLHAIVGAEYLLKLLPKGTHEYHRFIKPGELNRITRQNQLKPKARSGIHYNPLTQHYRLTDSLDVNYIIAYQKQAS